MKCENCGREYETKIDIESRFCGDKCRMKYHNKQNKLYRLRENILKSIQQLQNVIDANQEHNHAVTAFSLLISIEKAAKTDLQVRWQCKNCGQIAFFSPLLTGGTCDFCEHEDFSVKLISQNTPELTKSTFCEG